MDWIKRNLYFLIGGAVALALMGMAGWFLYSKYQANNAERDKLSQDYEELRRLNDQKPHPGAGQVNNVKVAQQQQQQVADSIQRARQTFKPVPRIPDVPEVTAREFSAALSRTLQQLQRDATNSSVVLPANYLFSFSAQNQKVTFAQGSLVPLSEQLGEVVAICDILFKAKVNSLDNLRRARVSTDDNSGQLSDYTEKKAVTNQLAVLAPYEVTFRCFSPELAGVLSGFASSPHGIVVKSINVELAPAPVAPDPSTMAPVSPIYVQTAPNPAAERRDEAAAQARMRSRYGLGGPGGRYGGAAAPTPAPQPQVYAAPVAAPKPSQQIVLNERQLKVTLQLNVVKLLSEKQQQAQPTDAQPAAAPQEGAQ